MKIMVIYDGARSELDQGVSRLTAALAQLPGWKTTEGSPEEFLSDSTHAAYLLNLSSESDYEPLLIRCRALDSTRLHRTILLGADVGWRFGKLDAPPGTLPHLLETFELAGAFTSSALREWREAPSAFSGPHALLGAMGTNCMKAFQSSRYCSWASAQGATLADFLARYLPVLDAHVTAHGSPTRE